MVAPKKTLVQLPLLYRIDHLGTLQTHRQEAGAPIDFAQAAFAIAYRCRSSK